MVKTMEIQIPEGEYWWGGIVQDGIFMPYRAEKFERDLSREQLNNQSSPLLLSNKGRYVWCGEPFRYSFGGGRLTLSAESGEIVVSDGHDSLRGAFLDASKKYFPPTGQYLDPLLFTAPQYNTWIEMIYEPTQEKVLKYAASILDNGLQPGVLMIDDNWQEDYGVWQFHPGRFPDPQKMISQLHEMGFKVMLWVCNFISPDSLTSRQAAANGYLIRTPEGKPAIAEWWNGQSNILDLSDDRAIAWFNDQLDRLTAETGVDGFKFDAGDMAHFRDDFVCRKPMCAHEYSQAWAKIGERFPLNEYRACWKQEGKPLAQRLSDKNHSWELRDGLGSLIPNGLAQGLLGYAFTCPDMIGGGEYMNFLENSSNLDMELIVRNAQCAALFPMMQFSVAPWRVLDKTYLDLCIEAARVHTAYGEKIHALAREASKTGEPIIRSMEYDFPGCGYEHIRDQFMLGDDLLVAPVLKKGAVSRDIVFPAGTWVGDDESVVEGPCTLCIDAPLSRLPRYEKQ